jgi:hypothetical protein
MKLSQEVLHDTLVATYQSVEASILNRVLAEYGINEPARREEIIAGFLFEQGVMLDQCWFEEDGKRWYPGVFFGTRPHNEIQAATVYLPSEEYGMNFHEYAHGAASWAIENEEKSDAIKVGNE